MKAGLEHILACIRVESMRGLEIGPLHNPVVDKRDGDVSYVDHADTETLRAKYSDDPNVSHVLDVDYVWGENRLADATADGAPFDYVIACHVIEHVPDPIGWLQELSEVIRPGGFVSLVIPDRRYCFDVRRMTTDVSELLAAHLEQRRRPALAQIYDFHALRIDVDTLQIWAGGRGYEPEQPRRSEAYEVAQKAMTTEGYIDVHCTTWTPASFVELIRTAVELDLLDVRFAAFQPTPFNSLEFYVTLQRMPEELTVLERRRQQLESIPEFREDQPLGPAAPLTSPPGHAGLEVSDLEARLIAQKRRVVTAARRALSTVRRAGHRLPRQS